MAERITEKQLIHLVYRINDEMGTPQEMFSYDEHGYPLPGMNEGNYHLDYAYGGVCLEQTMPRTRHGQGARDVFECGHVTKRDLYNRMWSYIQGAEDYNYNWSAKREE